MFYFLHFSGEILGETRCRFMFRDLAMANQPK